MRANSTPIKNQPFGTPKFLHYHQFFNNDNPVEEDLLQNFCFLVNKKIQTCWFWFWHPYIRKWHSKLHWMDAHLFWKSTKHYLLIMRWFSIASSLVVYSVILLYIVVTAVCYFIQRLQTMAVLWGRKRCSRLAKQILASCIIYICHIEKLNYLRFTLNISNYLLVYSQLFAVIKSPENSIYYLNHMIVIDNWI